MNPGTRKALLAAALAATIGAACAARVAIGYANAEDAYNRALDYEQLGDTTNRLACLKRAIDVCPLFTRSYISLARYHGLERRKPWLARKLLAVPKLFPYSADAKAAGGIQALIQGDTREAADDFAAAVARDASFAEAWCVLAALHVAEGDYSAALKASDRALILNPRFADAWAYRGLAHAGLGRVASAVGDDRMALRINPQCAEYHAHLSRDLLKTAPDESLAALEEAVRLDPKDAYVDVLCGMAAASQRVDVVDRVAARVMALPLPSPRQILTLAAAYDALSRTQTASDLCQKGLELYPGDRDLAAYADDLAAGTRLQPMPLVSTTGGRTRTIDDSNIHATLGIAEFNNHNYGAAIDAFRKAIARNPDTAQYRFFLGCASYFSTNATDRANVLPAFKEALRLAPTNMNYRLALAFEMDDQGDHLGAVYLFSNVSERIAWTFPSRMQPIPRRSTEEDPGMERMGVPLKVVDAQGHETRIGAYIYPCDGRDIQAQPGEEAYYSFFMSLVTFQGDLPLAEKLFNQAMSAHARRPAAACAQVDQHYTQAAGHLANAGNTGLAERMYQHVLDDGIDTNSLKDAAWNLASLYSRTGRFDEGLNLLEEMRARLHDETWYIQQIKQYKHGAHRTPES